MRAAVAAGHPETAATAAAVLAEGGTAVDAALAGLCTACVVEPVLASPGGGGFLVARPATGPHAGRTVVYDFFVQTPRGKRPEHEADVREVAADFGPARQTFHVGMGVVATPGVVAGLFAAHGELGRVPLRTLVEPACRLARDGVPVAPLQAYVVEVVAALLRAGDETGRLFASPDRPEALIGAGERLRLPELADTLEVLAIEGEALFYRGEIGRRLAEQSATGGGHLTMDDLEAYRVERRAPAILDAFGARLAINPPPAAGGELVAFGLALWSALREPRAAVADPDRLRRLAAVMRATALARRDPPPAIDGASWALLDPRRLDLWRDRIAGRPLAARGTTQISVVDAAGGAASLSVSNGEGAARVIPGTGIVLNNMLGEDDINPEGPFGWATDARMASMMAPLLVLERDGGVTALGSGGSKRIRTAVLQVLLNLLDLRLPLAEAIEAPRLHVEADTLDLEPGLPESIETALAGEVETVTRWPARNMFFGGVHAARRSGTGSVEAAGDGRRGGAVAYV